MRYLRLGRAMRLEFVGLCQDGLARLRRLVEQGLARVFNTKLRPRPMQGEPEPHPASHSARRNVAG